MIIYNNTMDDHYKTLGIEKTASLDEIKKAYRKLAMKYHPDRTDGDQEKFQQIKHAYEILSDPKKRQEYDNPPSFDHWTGPAGDFSDVFAEFFRRQNAWQHRPPAKNATVSAHLSITLDEAFTGKDIVATIKLPSGRQEVISIKIPAGVQSNTVLKLSGVGDDSNRSIPRGDVHVSIIVENHKDFQRVDNDLVKEVTINAFDALLGTSVEIETIDKKTLSVNVPAGIQMGTTLSVPGYGMPILNNASRRGRLIIPINIKIPTLLTEEQKELLKKARDLC